MDYSQLKNFKLRYFIVFAIVIFIASFISFFFVNTTANTEWITFLISICCLLYLLFQTMKWNFTYNEQRIGDTMTKGRWAKYLSLTATIQLMTVALTAFGLTLLYLLFEEQIRSLFDIFPVITKDVVHIPLIVYVLHFINICILAPIWEELLFRGILLRRFTLKWSPQKSIIVSSFIFAIIHLNPITIVFAFVLGCLLGYSYLKTKSILVPILLHSFSNFLAFIQFCIANQSLTGDLPTTEAATKELYITGGIFLLLLMIVLFIVFKYYNRFRQLTIQQQNTEVDGGLETVE